MIYDASICLDQLPLRDDLRGKEPYGAPQLDVAVALNVNENPYPPTAKMRMQMSDAVVKAARTINRYPDREARSLRQSLAEYLGFGLSADNIWAANGSNEVMFHLLTAFGGPGRTVLTFKPTYSMYPDYARDTHTHYVAVDRLPDYQLDATMILEAIEQHNADIVILCTPNNPTGTQIPVSVIDEVCASTEAIVIVDEAYQEFAEYPEDSSLALLPKYGRLIVTRTMSKAFGLAGARVGYLAAAKAVVDACRIVRLPYHLSAQTQQIAQVALMHTDEVMEQVESLREQCQLLQSWLRDRGYQVISSQANFCLFGRFYQPHDVWQALLDRGVLIREVGPEGFLRVSAGTEQQMNAFRQALCDIEDSFEHIGY